MSKRKTHEEYVSELTIKNPTVEVIDKYIDAKTPIMHHCLVHDVYWKASPSNVLQGKGCRECMKEKNKKKFTKTHEEYVSQVQNINPNIEVLEDYAGANTPIMHLCKKHNVKWKAIPTNILKGCGCYKCKSEKIVDKLFKSHEQYVKELSQKNPHIKVLEEYAGVETPILHYCIKHDEYWMSAPCNALKGCGCNKCVSERLHDIKCKSHENYVEELYIKNPNVEVVDKYINAETPIKHHCLIHDIYWDTSPTNVLRGCGCPECGKEKISIQNCLTHEQYIDELKIFNPNVIVLEQYVDMKTPILHKCLIHNIEWLTTPDSAIHGSGCIKCRSERISNKLCKTHEQYVNQVKVINPNIIVIGNYINSHTPILHKCLIDGNEWYAEPSNILSGCGCSQCNESKGEREIRLWLESQHITYECQKTFEDCCDIRPLPFDFYLPNYNKCIEYDGQQHFEPIDFFGGQECFEYTAKHDNIKNEYCKNNGISLLRIPYFRNINEELNNFLFI